MPTPGLDGRNLAFGQAIFRFENDETGDMYEPDWELIIGDNYVSMVELAIKIPKPHLVIEAGLQNQIPPRDSRIEDRVSDTKYNYGTIVYFSEDHVQGEGYIFTFAAAFDDPERVTFYKIQTDIEGGGKKKRKRRGRRKGSLPLGGETNMDQLAKLAQRLDIEVTPDPMTVVDEEAEDQEKRKEKLRLTDNDIRSRLGQIR